MNAQRAFMVWTVLGLAALAVFVASLALGSIAVSPLRVMQALSSRSTDVIDEIVLSLRLPRALGGFAAGALLGMAGALLQVLLRNPLAEPYVLGVSGGAAAFALAAMLFSLSWWSVDVAAFAGAFLSILLVLGLARR